MIYTLEDFNYAAIIAIHAMFSPSLFGIAFSLADIHFANRFAEDTRRKIQYGRLIFCSGTIRIRNVSLYRECQFPKFHFL